MSTVEETSPPPDHPAPAEPDPIRRAREALRRLVRLVADRAEAETAIETRRVAGDAAAEAEYARATQTLREKTDARDLAATSADEQRRRAIVDAAIGGEADAKSDFAKSSRRIASEFDATRQRAAADHQAERSAAIAAFDAADREANARFARARKPIDDASRIIDAYQNRLDSLFAAYQKFGLKEPSTTPTREQYKFNDPLGALFDRVAAIEKPLKLLEVLVIPKAMTGRRPLWLFVVAFAIVAGPLVALADWGVGLGVAVVAAIGLGFGLRQWLTGVARHQVGRSYYPVMQLVVDARALAAHILAGEQAKADAERASVATRRDEAILAAKAKQARTLSEGEANRDERLREINDTYARRMVEIQTRQQVDLRAAIETHDRKVAELRAGAESNARLLAEKFEALQARLVQKHESAWSEMAGQWRDGMAGVLAGLDDLRREVDEANPPATADRPAPRSVPSALRIGEVRVAIDDLPGGYPADPRLAEGIPRVVSFPALVAFPSRSNLLIDAPAPGRSAAIGVLQAAMLRLLLSLPPAAVRFTIIDPVGIGRNFGAFMHLADYDEALVNGQVWTEPRQIQERLDDLAAHMEKVTQKYLRNDYATLEAYNAAAGEVAEPYRVVVVADFPSGFDEKAANRLASIASAGVACGVLILGAVDRDRPLPGDLALDDLAANASRLGWDGVKLTWDDPDFGRFPLALDAMPAPEVATRAIQRIAATARDARRVEVPFEYIAPEEGDWWTGDSRTGVDVALGKAGANKRQHLALGKGTSQHVLVAGRTGSGKSTLLHALITNLALNYSPDEVELYLIDFKKGVEFKVYATRELPHAAIVAIESEREFGISVLQRLDAEMRLRGDRFRDAGVQDLNGFRNLADSPPLPRILLIVDEFQEFFVEEDKLAQEAALLLDRLVRQGRAFGVHVILGSQTLGGAFTLARTTIGQMAVRIALQCSESDAHLILSEQNTAARLLSRPGEAVYNDANGMAEGNHFFQVVWLTDQKREDYLTRIRDLARERPPRIERSTIVFEGDAPADLARNVPLRALLDAPSWPPSPRSATAWLGDPVAIKEPTSALFRRQGGSHLLIVGQNEDAARGVMAASMASLASQYPPSTATTGRVGARFFLIDGTPEDHPDAGALAKVAASLPHRVEAGGWRDVPRWLGAIAAEVGRRTQPDAEDGPEVFLMIHDLPRFRDLRKGEDEFSFSRREEAATPADHLKAILREGPAVGVHVIAWSDTLGNLQRSFDNQTLREFEMRVLFQMSQNDSGHLLDAPAASKLGPNRALFASEGQNRMEKFRPYGVPSDAWIAEVSARLKAR